MQPKDLKQNTVTGPIYPEPIRSLVVIPLGTSIKHAGKRLQSQKVYESVLNPDQVQLLAASPEPEPFDGDPVRFRRGVEALRLALAYEYGPYYSLSIARLDPLPHQLATA